MKKLLCYLLVFWFAVLSGGVSAHGVSDVGHAGHDHNTSTGFDKPAKVFSKSDATPTPAQLHDACAQSHCSHGHNIGVAQVQRTFACAELAGGISPARNVWQSAEARNDIERPKWRATTPVVVSLLA